jgi:glycine cleavage system H protein
MYFTEDHEWIKKDGDNYLIGITDHAQSELGDIVYVDLPSDGEDFSKGDSIGTIEAVKTVADIYVPFECKIVEVNSSLEDEASIINESPYEMGWIVKVSTSESLGHLMTEEEYNTFLGEC